MLFVSSNYLVAVQAPYRRMGVQQVSRTILIWTVLVAISFAVTACNKASGTTMTPNHPPSPIATRLTALLTGELTMVDGCLRAGGYLLVWPPEFTVSIDRDAIEVVDGLTGKKAVWHIRETVQLGGGEVSYLSLDEQVLQRLPARCQGAEAFWLVGDIVSPIDATQESK